MWVKICGITRHEDAILACELGADAVGFVFTSSPRKIDHATVSPWIREIHGVEKVAVFMAEGVDEILGTCEGLGIDTIQLHATPTKEHERLTKYYGIIYAMEEYQKEVMPDFPCRILIDSSVGKGIKGQWRRREIPYILTGGLNPDNVREAIRVCRPSGVDVSSGVELRPGIKDPRKVERFIREAKL